MKKVCAVLLSFFVFNFSKAQLLITTPDFPTDNSSITITLDATKGNRALQGFTEAVYLHTGVITSASTTPSDWKYVQGTWATASAPLATSAGTNTWSFTIPNIRSFYGVPAGETISKITILFRSLDGRTVQRNVDGSDMYIQVYQQGAFAAKFIEPFMQPTYIPVPELIPSNATSVNVKVVTSQQANTAIKFNTVQVSQSSNNIITTGTANINNTCEQFLSYESVSGSNNLKDTVTFFINPATYPTGARPSGFRDGITFDNSNRDAVFILYAPGKQKVQLVGDFNNWVQTCSGLMTKDGDYFWIRIQNLTPGQSYRFQYIVDEVIRFADPYSNLVLDPNNDRFISPITYPNMPQYPVGRTPGGFVGIITPGETPFNWTDVEYQRPFKYNLMIYEAHMRDMFRNESWQSLIDTLPYLVNLGFNAIQFMPINEFDGNDSWGYNPCYYFALDKAYGPKNKFKEFVNAAHRNGIAVIMDVVFNQATGQSPLAMMWWNSAVNPAAPASNNPYFFTSDRHPFGVFNDFNHSSPATRYHVDRFIEYWLTEYKIDGFRWDLSKGFTTADFSANATSITCPPPNNTNAQACWDSYNQGRINIWEYYNNKMGSVSPGSYCILEHLGGDAEEYQLAARGMLLWGKMNREFNENTMGTGGNKSLNRSYWVNRSHWNGRDCDFGSDCNTYDPNRFNFIQDKPGLIVYAESHDEDRIMFRNINFGATSTLRSVPTALARTEAMSAVFMGIPGPKMIWQFGELGYDIGIGQCPPNPFDPTGSWSIPNPYVEDGTCRTSRKPIRWNYFYNTSTTQTAQARKSLYYLYASMAKLRKTFPNAFNRATITNGTNFNNELRKSVVIDHETLKMVVIANFESSNFAFNQPFPSNGTWYDYMGPLNTSGQTSSITISGNNLPITLPPHSYKVYINQLLNRETSVQDNTVAQNDLAMSVFPNPVSINSVVKYDLPASGQVYMQLMNIQGQVLASKNLGFQMKGFQTLSLRETGFNASQLASGTYLLQLQVGKSMQMVKISVQK